VTQLGIAGTAIGVSKLVALGFFEQLPAEDILEIMATLDVVYLGLAGIRPLHTPPADPAAAPPATHHRADRGDRGGRRVAAPVVRPPRGGRGC